MACESYLGHSLFKVSKKVKIMKKSLSIKRKKEKDTFVWIYFGITSIEIVASRQIRLLLFEELVQGRHQDEEEKEHFALAGLLLLKMEPRLIVDQNSTFDNF